MITAQTDVQTLQHFIENWEKVIINYFKENKDNMAARKIVAQRNVGASVGIDVVQSYDRTEEWTAQVGIHAKGTVPNITGLNASSEPWTIYQNSTAFYLNAKDITQDPKAKSRLADIAAKNIHRFEDRFVLEGDSNLSINGIADMGAANDLGKIVSDSASGTDVNNKGKWTGETGTDIYDDVLTAKKKLGDGFSADILVGREDDLLNTFKMDSERQPYHMTIGGLFKKKPTDTSWMFMNDNFSSGTEDNVYLISKNAEGSEFVVAENPKLISYPIMAGQNYYFELTEWICFQAHDNQSVVQIAID